MSGWLGAVPPWMQPPQLVQGQAAQLDLLQQRPPYAAPLPVPPPQSKPALVEPGGSHNPSHEDPLSPPGLLQCELASGSGVSPPRRATQVSAPSSSSSSSPSAVAAAAAAPGRRPRSRSRSRERDRDRDREREREREREGSSCHGPQPGAGGRQRSRPRRGDREGKATPGRSRSRSRTGDRGHGSLSGARRRDDSSDYYDDDSIAGRQWVSCRSAKVRRRTGITAVVPERGTRPVHR
jgi:hypothetical protein